MAHLSKRSCISCSPVALDFNSPYYNTRQPYLYLCFFSFSPFCNPIEKQKHSPHITLENIFQNLPNTHTFLLQTSPWSLSLLLLLSSLLLLSLFFFSSVILFPAFMGFSANMLELPYVAAYTAPSLLLSCLSLLSSQWQWFVFHVAAILTHVNRILSNVSHSSRLITTRLASAS